MGGAGFAAACASGKIKLLESYTTEGNLRKLEAGRIQYYLNVSSTQVGPYPLVKRGPVVNVSDSYVGFTRKQDNFPYVDDFQEKFNGVVRQMKASEEIARIADAYGK